MNSYDEVLISQAGGDGNSLDAMDAAYTEAVGAAVGKRGDWFAVQTAAAAVHQARSAAGVR